MSNQVVVASDLPSKAPALLQELVKTSGSTLEVTWNSTTNTPALLSGQLSLPSKHSPEWIANEFLNKYKKLYGLQKPIRDMKVVKVARFDDTIHVHLQHVLFQTAVWEDWLVIELNNQGVIQKIEGTIHPNLEQQSLKRPMYPAITQKQALQKAVAEMRGEIINEPKVEKYYLSSRPGTPLVYVVELQFQNPAERSTFIIHSLTGRILQSSHS